MFARIKNFFIESRQELRQVHWPTRRDAIYLTILVIIVSAALSAFLGGLDVLFARVLQYFITKGG